MSFNFTPSDEVRKIRKRIDHPIVDADGHLIEVIPLLIDFIREEAGQRIADRFQALVAQRDPRERNVAGARVFWALPEENTLDRMTATLPELLYRRLDEFGVDFALLYPSMALPLMCLPDAEVRQAAVRACNRYYAEVFGGYRDRLEPVAVIPLFSPEEALAELDHAIGERGLKAIVANAVIPRPPGEGGRDKDWLDTIGFGSPHDFDPVWARINEAKVRVATHVGPTDYQKYGADLSEDPEAVLGDFDALQWVLYWCDRPAMETVTSMILHGLFERFPHIRVCMSEQGTTWLPYLLRKLDHAVRMGREAKWGSLERRPREVFREHFVVAPFPEENVERVVAEVGVEPIVFGSDFPHGEGLAIPSQYASTQLAGLPRDQVEAIMSRNLARFLARPA